MTTRYDVVIPTIGRPSLARLLHALDGDVGPGPSRVVVVDDRADDTTPLPLPEMATLDVSIVRGPAVGPAAARNAGWRRTDAPWICFLDDDVVPCPGWRHRLLWDLRHAPPAVAAIQGRVHVPLPGDRPPSERERNIEQLQRAAWITADMAVRRTALTRIGGLDERFPRAYREDCDLALRLMDAGHQLRVGTRRVDHPVRPTPWWASLAAQRGNADDALMRRLHGSDWRDRGQAPAGMLPDHARTTALAGASLVALLAGHTRLAIAGTAAWALRVFRFFNQRRTPGHDRGTDLVGLAATSLAIPPLASYWSLAGRVRARRLAPRGRDDRWRRPPPQLVLFDRDGTLVRDVPYNGDPDAVVPLPGAKAALDRLRDSGIAVGLITNQSGVARGLIDPCQVDAVNQRVADLLGPFHTVQFCAHGPGDGCACRKPAPGMVLDAARELGVRPDRCAVVGDIGADVGAGLAAGANTVLVPTHVTLPEEVDAAPAVASDLDQAVDLLLGSDSADSHAENDDNGQNERRS